MNEFDRHFFISEVAEGPAFAAAIFRRKYQADIPVFAHHIVAFARLPEEMLLPVGYLHMTAAGRLMLAGGACTDGERVRALPVAARAALAVSGGLLQACLLYAFARFASNADAVAACCGDPRALQVTPSVGFEPTDTPHLLVRWCRPLGVEKKRILLNQALAAMPF